MREHSRLLDELCTKLSDDDELCCAWQARLVCCGERGDILSDGSVRVRVLPCQPVAMLEPPGRPSLSLVMRAITTGGCTLTLVIGAMLLMPAGVPSLTRVMNVVLPPGVRMPRTLTACIVPILVGAASILGQ